MDPTGNSLMNFLNTGLETMTRVEALALSATLLVYYSPTAQKALTAGAGWVYDQIEKIKQDHSLIAKGLVVIQTAYFVVAPAKNMLEVLQLNRFPLHPVMLTVIGIGALIYALGKVNREEMQATLESPSQRREENAIIANSTLYWTFKYANFYLTEKIQEIKEDIKSAKHNNGDTIQKLEDELKYFEKELESNNKELGSLHRTRSPSLLNKTASRVIPTYLPTTLSLSTMTTVALDPIT
jgi:hypothetical protein